MSKKEFVPLLGNPLQLVANKSGRPVSEGSIIKKSQSDLQGRISGFRPAELSKGNVDILVFEQEGEIRQIRFKCGCGCQASVDLVPADQQVPPSDSQE